MIILVIGPSGVGKSTCVEHAGRNIQGCRIFRLDYLVGQRAAMPAHDVLRRFRADDFLRRCKYEINALAQSSTHLATLVDVGPGALESAQAGAWLSDHQDPIVAVIAPPEEVYSRWQKRNPSTWDLRQFTKVEFSPRRQSLYALPRHRCNVTGLTSEQAGNRFVEIIRSLLCSPL